MPKKFLRRDSARFSKFGKRRKKLQKWKRPTGRDNKMREKRRGYPKVVSIGYGTGKKLQKSAVIVKNIKDLEKADKNKIIIIGTVGEKKRIEIAKKAKEMKIEVANLNVKKFLGKISKAKTLKDKKVVKGKTDKKEETKKDVKKIENKEKKK